MIFLMSNPLRTNLEKKNKSQYCRFHQDVVHDADDCPQLKNEIEFVVHKGRLNMFTKDGGRNKMRDQDDRGKNRQSRGPVLNIIIEGPTTAGSSRNSRKAYAREDTHIIREALKHTKACVVIIF